MPYPNYVRQTNFVRITAKIAFSCRRTRLRIISEKRPDDSSPVFLLAKRSLEDSYQRVVLTLSQSMTFRIDEL